MSYFFYVGVCICLVLLQSTIMPNAPLLDKFYDLVIPFIVYLGIWRPARESLPVALFTGFIMDSLSGSPFGLYMTTYFWLFVAVKVITQLLQIGDHLLIVALIVVGGVLAENSLFLATVAIVRPENQFPTDVFKIVVYQLIWAVCTGPLLLMLVKNTHNRLQTGLKRIFPQQNQHHFL